MQQDLEEIEAAQYFEGKGEIPQRRCCDSIKRNCHIQSF